MNRAGRDRKAAAMNDYDYDYNYNYDYQPSAFSSRPQPQAHNSSSYDYPLRPRSPPPSRRQRPRIHAWPPSPSVEDEPPERSNDDQPPTDTRGAVDQETIIEDIVPDDPPVFTQRVSTPYAYTKPQQPSKPTENVFDDSDLDAPDTSHLRASERRPARYSFVKSDLHKEDIRTNLYDARPQPDTTSIPQTPTSSSSSLHSNARNPKLTPSENPRHGSSRPTSRPASPSLSSTWERPSPDSRPTSANNTRPASPAMFQSPVSLTDAGRQSTYPPITVADRSRPPSRIGRHETLPTPAPRIDVQSPSPARRAAPGVLPYPVDDRPMDVFMPAEENYQFDHSSASSLRQPYPESTRVSSVPVPSSPRLRDGTASSDQTRSPIIDRPARAEDSRPGSSHSRPNRDVPRERVSNAKIDLEKPLPSCPRSYPSSRYDDWYSLKGYRYFDICPHCYQGVFATTPFAPNFSQTRLGEKPTERVCDFSSPWIRLAWLLTIKQRLPSLEMIYALADISEIDRPCPDDRELSSDRITWYGLADPRNNIHVANFAICSSDKRMIEALLPTMRGYFTILSNKTYSSNAPEKFVCSLRTSSRRFPKYLDLLVQLDVEAQGLGQRPNMHRFIQMARENAFKGECAKSKSYSHKAWHFMPSLPEFTICEECYEEVVWPAMQSRSVSSTIPRLVNKTIQLVPDENNDAGTSCMLYSPRMRKVWDVSVREEDFAYLKRKVLERKKAEIRIAKERKSIVNWMMGLERGSLQWDRAKSELRELEQEWAIWE